ncbi:MAG: hypothetical protein PHD76_03080 [Methylacidiphilales bacterium]|nr:hypothetical protein [Candidatus Methylacidiphilales bacterium]
MKTAVADQKRRIVLPGVSPGDVLSIQQTEPGHFELSILIPTPKKSPPTPSQVRRLKNDHALTPSLSWKQLRKLTRES